MPGNDKVEDLTRRLEAAERERELLATRVRSYERGETDIKVTNATPFQTAWQAGRLWLGELLVALLLGLMILGLADYLLTNDAIPLLRESVAITGNTSTSNSTNASTGGSASGSTVPVTTNTPGPPTDTAAPALSLQVTTTTEAINTAGTGVAVANSATPVPAITTPNISLTPGTLAAPPTAPAATSTPEVHTSSRFLQDSFDTPTSGWPVRDEPAWSSSYTDGHYQLLLKGESTAGVSIPLSMENYRLGVDVILGEQSNAGLIVLFQEPATFYQIAFRSNGTYAIQSINGETITNVTDWTESATLRQGSDVTNRIHIERQDAIIRFFANEQMLTEFSLPTASFQNRFGFTLTSVTGQGQASFDNLVGEKLSASE